MASSSTPLNEELLCSICLDVFTDPVTTPCGHNFCRACLNKCWTITKYYRYCPICKDIFSKRLHLEINTTLREIVEYFKKLNQDKSKVFCVLCCGKKQKAVKSCLTCESSYCETHLEPHLRVPRLQKHKLINAVGNLEDYICEKHQRPLELFCRDDQTCVCLSCTEGEHRNHDTVPIVQENQLLQTHQMIQERMKKIQKTQHSVKQRKTQASNDFFTSYQTVHISNWLIISLGVLLVAALFIIPVSVQYSVSGDYKWFSDDSSTWIIKELKRRNTELEQLLHAEDHFLFLQMYSSLYSLSHAETSTDSDVDSHTLKRAQTLKILLNEKLRQSWLKWVQMYAVDVTLDPDTANPNLILSDDGKQVIHGGIKQDVPENPKRFEKYMCVLAIDRFSSGRFFYEVQVKGKTEWYLGLAIESINRKKIIQLTPLNGFWIVALINGDQYIACESPPVSLSLRVKPEKVGVFVDYEEGLISFYDVDSGSHIYSFTGQTFTDKLFPLFSPGHYKKGENSNPLIITSVS